MTCLRALFCVTLLAGTSAAAIYAPISTDPAPENFTASVRAGASYDSNIFGAPTNEIGSFVYELAPRFAYQLAPSPPTLLAASYQLTLDYFARRPGTKTLYNQELNLRAVHAFSPASQVDITDFFQRAENPAVLLNCLPYNTNQSLYRNQFDARYIQPVGPRTTVQVKERNIYYNYDGVVLGDELDRFENVAGASGAYAWRPDTKLIGEYRHQDILYRRGGSDKNKHSDFLMTGADYAVGPQLAAGARVGFEYRRREGEADTTAPYVEATAHYDYGERSFLAGGYVYTLEETSDIVRFDDTRIHRLYVDWQQALSPLVTTSATIAVEPSELHGRRGQPNVAETNLRAGVQATYKYSRHWAASVTYDYDRVDSDDASRNLRRSRTGVVLSFTY